MAFTSNKPNHQMTNTSLGIAGPGGRVPSLLIDGNSLVYRAFYGSFAMVQPGRVNTNAVFTTIKMLSKLIDDRGPFGRIYFFFDRGKMTFRHQENSDYKANRKKTPSELIDQLPIFKRFLTTIGIEHYETELYEADDLIGSAADKLLSAGIEAVIATSDRDLLQLVKPGVKLLLFDQGVSKMKEITSKNFGEHYDQLSPHQFLVYKTLIGDKSDNLPGIPGIGQKNALKLVRNHDSLNAIFTTLEADLDGIAGVSTKLANQLVMSRELAFQALSWTTIIVAAPLPVGIPDLSPAAANSELSSAPDFASTKMFNFYLAHHMPSLVSFFTRKIRKQQKFGF